MKMDIRLPELTGGNTQQQLEAIRGYLFQFARQLQWAMETVEQSEKKKDPVRTPGTAAAPGSEQAASFAQIKSLILKSSDLVRSFTDRILRELEGEYVAQSEFGDYSRVTGQQIEETSQSVTRLFTDLQTLSGTVDSLWDTQIATSAYLRSGLLEDREDGTPIFGLEIGQTTLQDGQTIFQQFARFAPDRLSFYDRNRTEVAYISDYKLFITNAQVTGTLQLGTFRLDTANGLAFCWMGG